MIYTNEKEEYTGYYNPLQQKGRNHRMSNQSQSLLKPPSFPKRTKNREKCEEIRWINHDILLLINLHCLTYLPLEVS